MSSSAVQPSSESIPPLDGAAGLSSGNPRGSTVGGMGWGWFLLAGLVVMSFVDLRRGLDGRPAEVSAYIVGFGLCTVVGAPAMTRMWRHLARPLRWFGMAFVLLLAWSLGSALFTQLPVVQRGILVPRAMLLWPILSAALTFTAALATVCLLRPAQRRPVLWWACWTLLACSVVAWPRAVMVHRSSRLATGMGGSAIYHSVMLLVAAVMLGCAVEGYRRRLSGLAAALGLGAMVATGSRAGLGEVLLFGILLLAWQGRVLLMNHWRAMVVAAAVVLVPVLALEELRRLVSISDPLRARNLHTAMSAWAQTPGDIFLGLGSGRMWPWYAFDTQLIPAPGGGLVRTAWGLALTSPHSTILAVLVELGLVGAVLLGSMVGCLLWRVVQVGRMVRQGKGAAEMVVLLAVITSLVGWVFDTYLLKNFGVSYWWWVVLLSTGWTGAEPSSTTARQL